MKFFRNILIFFAPFVVGLVAGALGLLIAGKVVEDPLALTYILASLAGGLMVILLVCWAAYRIFIRTNSDRYRIWEQSEIQELIRSPNLVLDNHYREQKLVPVLRRFGSLVGAWFGFAAACGVITVFLTNVLLLSTLVVQMASVERLDGQNSLLYNQNKLVNLQARIEAISNLDNIERRYFEIFGHTSFIHSFYLSGYGEMRNDGRRLFLQVGRMSFDCSEGLTNPCGFDIEEALAATLQGDKNDENLPNNFWKFVHLLGKQHKARQTDVRENSTIADIGEQQSSEAMAGLYRRAATECLAPHSHVTSVTHQLYLQLRLEEAAAELIDRRVSSQDGEYAESQIAAVSDFRDAYIAFRDHWAEARGTLLNRLDFLERNFQEPLRTLQQQIEITRKFCSDKSEERNRQIQELHDFLNGADLLMPAFLP